MNHIQDPIDGFDSKLFASAGMALYLNEKAADVHFVLKSGERIPAHKLLLAAVSERFETMFNGPEPEDGYVEIVDTSADALKKFLQFFYFNKVELTMENVGNTISLGSKYGVQGCLDSCREFLQSNITIDTVCQIYNLAITHDLVYLRSKCEVEIWNETKDVFKSDGFLGCNKEVLEHILRLDYLSCSEMDVFEACMSWVRKASGNNELTRDVVTEHLGNLFFGIQFRSMTLTQFIDLLPKYGQLFSTDQLCEILQMIRNKEYEPKQFSGEKRIRLHRWNESAVFRCDRFLDGGQPYLMGNVDVTQFQVNKPLALGKVSCEPIYKSDNKELFATNLPVELTIVAVPNRDKVLYKAEFELNNNAHTVMNFATPVYIRAARKYEIRLDIQQSVYCDVEMKAEVRFRPDIKVKFYDDKGMISSLYFNHMD